jgi:alkanesulfonate monooxygenase SsuD/methylene tetrahydromethanopterin reductase-like flavin-dependent oxidoreductase (luciferase family)
LLLPCFGKASHPETLARLASEAEKSHRDGFFLSVNRVALGNKGDPVYDTFTSLAAIALKTSRIRLGTLVTPLPRFKPLEEPWSRTRIDSLSEAATRSRSIVVDESSIR